MTEKMKHGKVYYSAANISLSGEAIYTYPLYNLIMTWLTKR